MSPHATVRCSRNPAELFLHAIVSRQNCFFMLLSLRCSRGVIIRLNERLFLEIRECEDSIFGTCTGAAFFGEAHRVGCGAAVHHGSIFLGVFLST